MNAAQQAHQSGAEPNGPVADPHQADLQRLSYVTAGLSAALAAPDDFPRLAQALSDNRNLWVRLVIGVADETSGVPPSLRDQILSLFKFTWEHTSLVLRDKATAEVLVDINTALLRGLEGQILASPPVQAMVYQ